ncbi:MAG: flagellar export protein FliJ [Rubrivivax sp.]|nr:flagellar export protein FliJ [Rubrivivax sp.]
MTQPLQTLIEHAERERDAALAGVLQADENLRRLQTQQQQLQAYQADYASRAPALGGHSATIAQLRAHHAFMQRLQQALLQQQGVVAQAEGQLRQRREQLLACEIRLASVAKLVERRLQEVLRQSARQEQKRSDEAASQRQGPGGGSDALLML